jgi:hypothetical protein
VRVPSRDEADRTAGALRKACKAMSSAARNISALGELKATEQVALRKKLVAALEALDAMSGDAR